MEMIDMKVVGNLKLNDLDAEEIMCNGKETIIIKPKQIKVFTTAKEVIKEMRQ